MQSPSRLAIVIAAAAITSGSMYLLHRLPLIGQEAIYCLLAVAFIIFAGYLRSDPRN